MFNLSSYRFAAILLIAVILGGFTGYVLGPKAIVLQPLGQIFLNLMFTVIPPLIFFSVASAIANINVATRLLQISYHSLLIFLFASSIAAIFMLFVVNVLPVTADMNLATVSSLQPAGVDKSAISTQIIRMISVADFSQLFLPENMLPLIFLAILLGLATLNIGEKGKLFAALLQTGAEVFMKLILLIMYYAPIGFFAFFAVLASDLGTKIVKSYVQVTLIYYFAATVYFVLVFSFYAYLAAKKQGVKLFWRNVLPPAITALATCSSAASIAANLQAAKNMRVPAEIYEIVLPIGTIVHKQGSILGGVIKIAFLFSLFHMQFVQPMTLLIALIVAVLVGTVMGAIPSGGMLGEMFILSVYGFPLEVLAVIAVISIIIRLLSKPRLLFYFCVV
jgi:Na+/H+-dicarboxylate symporter